MVSTLPRLCIRSAIQLLDHSNPATEGRRALAASASSQFQWRDSALPYQLCAYFWVSLLHLNNLNTFVVIVQWWNAERLPDERCVPSRRVRWFYALMSAPVKSWMDANPSEGAFLASLD